MKKKIINGILLAAMLFAGTTSFVSCKDNVDDELVPVWTDLTDLKGRVATLEGTVAGHTQDIAKLRADLTTLEGKYTALEGRVTKNEADIATLNAEYEALEARVAELEKWAQNLLVDVTVQGTADPVFGRLNGAIIAKNTLCGFVGKNGTGITSFPVLDGDGELKAGNKLTTAEVPADDYIEFNPDNKYLNDYVNLGKVYITLNPIGLDATKVAFDIMNTVGEKTGAEFGTPVPNTTILTESFLSRNQKIADYVAYNNFPVVWEVPVKMATTGVDFDNNLFDYLNFGGEGAKYGKWNFNNLQGSIDNIWKTLTKQDGGATPRYQKYAEAIVETNKLFGAIKEGIDMKREELNNYGIFATNLENGLQYFSKADIVSVAMEPISYKTADLFDGAGVKFDLTNLKAEVKRIIGNLQEKMPKINIARIDITKVTGALVLTITTDPGVESGVPSSYTYNIGAGTTLTQEQATRWGETFNAILARYKYISGSPASEGNHIAEDLTNKVENFLNLMAGDIIDYYGGKPAMTAVEPILLMSAYDKDGNYKGIVNLADTSFGLPNKLNGTGILPLALTSLTKDYIVPVYKKYIGVVQDGKLIDGNYTIADGDQQVFFVDIPEGKSTIVIQTLDYSGNVITKKFDIEAKAE